MPATGPASRGTGVCGAAQRFDDSGQFKCLYLVKENRVIDSVSGAMEEFHGISSTTISADQE